MKTPHALSGILKINYESPVPSASHKFHQINRKNNPLPHHLSITEFMLYLMETVKTRYILASWDSIAFSDTYLNASVLLA